MATRNTAGAMNAAEKITRNARQIGAPGTGAPFAGQLLPAVIVSAETSVGPYRVAVAAPDGEPLTETSLFPVHTWPRGITLAVDSDVWLLYGGPGGESVILVSGGTGTGSAFEGGIVGYLRFFGQ